MTLGLALGTSEILVGLIQGLCYALLGLGLVLVYRASGIVHFAYGEIGALGAVVMAKLILDKGWPWWVAAPVVVIGGGVIGAMWEVLVVRRLAGGPRLMLLVATIAIAQLMLVLQFVLPAVENRDLFPTAFDLHQPIGGFVLRGDHVAVLVVVPLAALALAWFLNRSITGLAIRGAAANLDAASLAGVRVKRVSTTVWAIAGALATLTFVLVLPVRGYVFGGSTAALGPGLLLRALVVGLVGRMASLPMTVLGGVVFGVVESILLSNLDSPGAVDMLVFVLLVVLLLARGAEARDDLGQMLVSAGRRLPRALAEHPTVRRVPALVLAVALLAATVLPFLTSSPARHFTFAKVVLFALAGLSVTVVTGWAGQLSLCQYAFVGVGAFVTAGLTSRGMGFAPAVALAVVVTAACACIVGFPALRIRGLFLAMVTLGFAVGAQSWLLQRDVFAGPGGRATVRRGDLGPVDLTDQRTYYFVCLAVLVVVAGALARLRRTGVGLAILAVRDNEPAASAATLSPATVKLVAFGLSGAVAGLAGALLGGLFVDLNPFDFGPEQSVLLLTMTIIGGVGSVAGTVLGALYLIGLPNLFEGSTVATLLTGGAGLLALVLWSPGGLLELAQRAWRAAAERWVVRGAPTEEAEPAVGATKPTFAGLPIGARATGAADVHPDELVVSCRGVDVRFGGLVANRAVDLQIRAGETVGLIGTNGAGKSTLLNAIAGAVPVSSGSISLFGHDVTRWPAHARADLGVGRVFQDARLFGQLTVTECVLVALEARRRSELVPSLLGLPPARRDEATKRRVAREVVELCGLGVYADRTAAELSTGTRRVCELACLIAGGARLLLLDEPTAGVAQREVEAFGAVIRDVQRQLGATVLLIEHDMPLVMSLCDRVVCMTAGEVIADGPPDEVRSDPKVVAAYLGTDERAIARSDLVGARGR